MNASYAKAKLGAVFKEATNSLAEPKRELATSRTVERTFEIAFVLLILFTSMDQRESADVKEHITSRQYIPVSKPIV